MNREQKRRLQWGALLAVSLFGGVCGCKQTDSKQSLKIAYSGIGDPNTWFLSFSDQMSAEAGRRGHQFFRRIAKFDNDDQKHQESQIQDVKDLMTLNPDALVLGPVAVNRALRAVDIADGAGVPVIVVNRDAEDPVPAVSDKYFATIHSDFYAFGKEVCGKQLRKVFGPNAEIKVLHLKGTEGGSNTIGMNNGCKDAMRADGHMAIACDASKPVLANIKGGLQYGAMTTSPYYAAQVFDAIEKHLAGQKVDAFIPVIDFFIDVNNVGRYEAFGF
jgi:ABC-type sugar transport system substrate-binding protein